MDRGIKAIYRIYPLSLEWSLYDEHNRPEDKNIKYIKELLLRHNINPIIALEYKVYNQRKKVQRIKLK